MITVDRIEEEIAVVDDNGRMINIPLSELPVGTKEGSLLVRKENGFALDLAAEKKARREMALLTKSVIKKSNSRLD